MFTAESSNNYFSNLEIRNIFWKKVGNVLLIGYLLKREMVKETTIFNYLKIFEKDSRILIHDNFHNIDIEVKFDNGIPVCILCNTYGCAHIGFAIV